MAPPRTSNPAEYNEFIRKLAAYHEKRGTQFDPNPKVANKHIDLLQLFNSVVEHGGYDRVSDEKLAWRKISTDFGLPANNLPAVAFSLKTVFYKYLAAYEITTIHGREPPPKEILEETTAKGAGLLTRTIENYRPSTRREAGALGNEHSEASGDDGTPARERNGSEEAPGSGGRVTRGLRQAPPQRILFQPDVGPSRPSRNASATSHASSPQHTNHQHHHQQQQPRGASTSYNPSSNMENMSLAVANYEPRLYHPLTLRPVVTPGNNPGEFARRQKALKDAAAGKPLLSKQGGIMLPGTGFDGPNIYVRCLCALRSGIPSEQDYALHHLVKISMERGDKYRFEGFPGLAEALVEKVLEVASLFYKVDWEVAYTEDGITTPTILNGIDGTPDILQRISSLSQLDVDDNIQTAEFSDKMLQINEAALTLRNMVMLEDNAYYVSELASLRDLLSIVLNLPKADSVVELKHYALDIAEQLTKYLHLDETDPLYFSLLAQLQSDDRGAILTSLRAISRISMNLEENNLLKGVPAAAIQNIIDWTLLNDEELAHACLDFLYQYTAVVDNVDFLLSELQVEPLINQLVRLLTHGAKFIEREYAYGREGRRPAPAQIAPLPQDLLPQLLKLEEPERSSQWLRCLFEEDPEESITQIALWQSYQACFTPTVAATGHPLLPAAEFIKNVSTTFAEKAAAQVQPGVVQKFIIKGIRMRSSPVGFNGEETYGCAWGMRSSSPEPFHEYFMSPEQLYRHILKTHLGATQQEDGKFENTSGQQYTCLWNGCNRFKAGPATSLLQIATHIKVHLSPKPTSRRDTEFGSQPPAKRLKPSYIVSPTKLAFSYQVTAIDERQDAAGIPLSAVLVLRNLARNLSKTEAEETALKSEGGVSWVDRLFKPVEQRLFEVMTHNKSLTVHMTDLLSAIRDA
ncbi:hypothetical protein EG329_011406 [Mollisiaceae sp. DMI_Dod_QoI]|nr:hypothetical protein EG329_011406 [Helotiales sp. DMI_Dod_QoI]